MIFTYKGTKYLWDYQLFYELFLIPNWGIVLNKIIVIRSLRINSISQRLTRLLQHHEFCYLSHYEYEQNKSICVYFYCYLFIIFLHTNRSHKSPRCIQEHYLKNGLCFYVYPIKSLIFFDCFVNLIRTDLAKLSSNELYLLIHYCPRNSFNISKSNKLIVTHQNWGRAADIFLQ